MQIKWMKTILYLAFGLWYFTLAGPYVVSNGSDMQACVAMLFYPLMIVVLFFRIWGVWYDNQD